MKSLKNILMVLTTLLLLFTTTNSIAQNYMKGVLEDGAMPNTKTMNSTFLDVPNALKSNIDLQEAQNSNGVKTLIKYSAGIGGNVSISFDKKNKIIAILVFKNIDAGILVNIQARTGDPCPQCSQITMGEIQFAWCIANCIIDTINDILE